MIACEADANVMLQTCLLVERPRQRTSSATARLGDDYATFLTVFPRVETAVLDDVLQVVAVCKVIQLCDVMLFEEFLELLPIVSFVHNGFLFIGLE